MSDGITVRCVLCKKTRLIGFEEARSIGDQQPICDVCFMPMVAIKAEVRS